MCTKLIISMYRILSTISEKLSSNWYTTVQNNHSTKKKVDIYFYFGAKLNF